MGDGVSGSELQTSSEDYNYISLLLSVTLGIIF